MKHPDKLRHETLEALRAIDGASVQAIAGVYGVHHSTVTRWAKAAGLKLPPARSRVLQGARAGATRRWGDWQGRQQKAKDLRATGELLFAIAKKLHYRSISGVFYSVRSKA